MNSHPASRLPIPCSSSTQAAWSLGQIESNRAVEALLASYDDENQEVREQVLWALAQIEDDRSIDVLIKASRDADLDIRLMAVHALSEFDGMSGDDIRAARRKKYLDIGEQLWKADVGSNTNGWGTAASPVIRAR